MLRTIIAHTSEIDDIELAIKEINSQIKPELLGKNSIGIVYCHYEFLYSGAMKAICDSLPFDTIGTISLTQATNEMVGTFIFTVMVLTGDDTSFVTTLSAPLTETDCNPVEKAYVEAAIKDSSPALILPFIPFMSEVPTDEYVDLLTRVSGGVPCFGTVALFDIDVFVDSNVFLNGECYTDRVAMLLIYSNIKPRFLLNTISPEKILSKPALVTKSEKNIIKEINGRPVIKYFEELGLGNAGEKHYEMSALPFMVDYGDNTPLVSKIFIAQTPEKYIVCAGIVPEGSKIYIGVFDRDDVLYTTGKSMDEALSLDLENASCMLMYSCVARNMSLGADDMAELNLVRNKIKEKLPFVMAYSGGEICPTQVSDSKAVNRFHNNTFIACIL